MMRRIGIGLALVFVLVGVGVSAFQKERLLRDGAVVLLELAPVDPRSLMQGDYMALRYDMAATLDTASWPTDGLLVVRVGANGVATFVRRHRGSALAEGEHLLRYRVRDGMVRLGAEAFFFQEGHADRYDHAKYGELRVADDGESVLVGLRDARRRRLR
jgi:uncharacterized membrane-anchored protein